MRVVIQRVSRAEVRVEDAPVGSIGPGLLVLLGVGQNDSPEEARLLAEKIVQLRIFGDTEGKFNLSVRDVGGSVLVVSQFTLFADTRRGRRPSFINAAPPELAAPLVERFMDAVRASGVTVAGGRFGAHMEVELVNDGPVTIMLDSQDWQRSRRSSSSGLPSNS
ncbi:MAG TPA: D-aminoacyl-tRNA deacylase [Ktedonobacterales bacterium]|jgi:D-tyrosyl-tRNA(Tyr) deacylase